MDCFVFFGQTNHKILYTEGIMEPVFRTDLAMERWNAAKISHGRGRGVPGVTYRRTTVRGIDVHTMTVGTEEAANILCKPIGQYYTISLEKTIKRVDDSFSDTAQCIGALLRKLLPTGERYLVVCLGNPQITPDAVGPRCAESVMVTRHLKEWMPEDFAPFSSVSLICPGVLGTTGIESANIVKGVVDAVKPDAVIAVDALAASAADRLCRTVQICDTGIEPGSGVGNRRFALNRETLGVPVISIGVPTVVDADTFINSIAEDTAPKHSRGEGMFITPREIDSFVAHSGKLLGYGINFALHDDLTLGDIDMFVG